MKPEEAIKILTTYMEGSDEAEPVDFDNALKLGIQALRAIKLTRGDSELGRIVLLKGETP